MSLSQLLSFGLSDVICLTEWVFWIKWRYMFKYMFKWMSLSQLLSFGLSEGLCNNQYHIDQMKGDYII